ncbi:hypothetical protein TSUD_395420 [Trifolium subterraneum]|uniref:Reverse transcriptase domain-containing protein n=1 Tax=Trifolium subterraneum TaxID=3900 RepID=A0A2Z6N5V1_TRISU|nr:hypothetical protein TSUD_395420 [Trifolium subterraneum]
MSGAGRFQDLFYQFHANECIPNCLMSYFLTLVPKIKSPQGLGDFRPISLLGCLYKILAKVLAAPLALVIETLIPKTQTAFLKGRQLVEGIVVVNEVIDYSKKTSKECVILNVDFEKAYDLVDWGFLDHMLLRFGFCVKWRAWMRACVCAGNMSILVNGSPTEEISIKRGLKQGDPPAPLLFLLVAEDLGSLMRRAVELNRFKPFLVGREGVSVSILQYADDTLCIGETTGLMYLMSSLIWRRTFLFAAEDILRSNTLDYRVGANPRKLSTWEPMLNTIKGRLGAWGSKYVTLGGRIVLSNAVLNAIPIFYLSFLKMPGKVWKEVVKIQRTFLWGDLSNKNRMCWVKWEDVCKPKEKAGLGIRDLIIVNISLLAKWRWKLLPPDSDVWKEVVVARYGQGILGKGNLGVSIVHRLASSWWKGICNLDKDTNWFSEAVEKKVGDRNFTNFWTDIWVGNQSLQQRFPRIYGNSNQKESTIAGVGRRDENMWRWVFNWRRNFFAWEEPIKTEFLELIQQFVPSESQDIWLWRQNTESGFSVKDCYVMLQQKFSVRRVMDPIDEFAFTYLWKGGAPSKVCAFSWQMLLDRIQTKDNLRKRGDFTTAANKLCLMRFSGGKHSSFVSLLFVFVASVVSYNEMA